MCFPARYARLTTEQPPSADELKAPLRPDDAVLTKAEALRRSQAALRAKLVTAHPFFWAAFVLVGDGGVVR